MNVVKTPIPKVSKGRKTIYIILSIICVIAIAIAVYMQFFQDEKLGLILGLNKFTSKSDSEYDGLKANFDQLFDNTLSVDKIYEVTKIDSNKDIVFTAYSNVLQEENKYDLNVNIPYINIVNETIQQYNEDIQNTFIEKANSILKSSEKNTIYTIDYTASIVDDILSVVIRSNLKEGNSVQRSILLTYNYHLVENREVTIDEILEKKGIDKQYANAKIKEEIELVERQVKELEALGYTIYARDSSNEMYEVENTKQFFIDSENHLYIIYPYGNDNFTSEMDIVVF